MIDKGHLPKGWTIAKFEDLLDYIQPTNYIVKSTEYKDTYKTPVLTAGKSFIKGYTNETDGIFNQLPTIIFDDFTTATQFVNFPFKVKSSAMKILQPTCDLVNLKLAYYFMQIQQIKGETHKRFWISEYSQLLVPLAPVNEQKRIIAKIEELITDLDKGIEYLETAQRQIRIYRRAVLKWTFEGKNQNSKKFILKEAAKIQIGPFGTQLHKEDYIVDGVPLINPMHIQEGKILANRAYTISKKKRDSLPNYILQEGDVIMGRRGEMARCGLVTEKEDGWFCGTGSLYVRPNKKLIDSKYLYCFLTGDTAKSYLEEKAGGTTMANLNLKIVNNMPISLPSINDQIKIVHEIESRLSVCDKIEETIETSLLQAEALRLSIIKKAFEGKLVPQNPSDEPAEKLLERIRALRHAQGKQGKVKPGKKEKLKVEKKQKRKEKIEI